MAEDLNGGILIVDFGSQTTLLIARRLREMGVYSEVWACNDKRLKEAPQALAYILSGGPASVGGENAPTLTQALLTTGRPILGICYGMQLLGAFFGGKVGVAPEAEYGRQAVRFIAPSPLQAELGDLTVWMSHSDAVLKLPSDFQALAQSEGGILAAMAHQTLPIYGVQYHPEVTHSEGGADLLRRFAMEIAGADGQWSPGHLIDEKCAQIRAQVGEASVICGLSGGVDSTVTAALIAQAIGDRLVCILVDHGLLRHGEADEVRSLFEAHFDVQLIVVDAKTQFLQALAGVTDPEAKRKIIGKTFIDVFEATAKDIPQVGFLAQGTLYPDVIESTSVRGPASKIKSHHNVGGLPERLPFALLEPLRNLFKDEVRALGRALDLPEHLVDRHPFPGPGLAIRILGEVTEERLAALRHADRIFISMLREYGLYHETWQAFAVLLPIRTVGVKGDARVYDQVLALRAVTSVDGMTADRADLPLSFLGAVATRIANEVEGVGRVVYDLSSKPPGTIEWE